YTQTELTVAVYIHQDLLSHPENWKSKHNLVTSGETIITGPNEVNRTAANGNVIKGSFEGFSSEVTFGGAYRMPHWAEVSLV
ncbi:hypothetical protein ACPV5W_20255, partial [Vibrio astriarenae]